MEEDRMPKNIFTQELDGTRRRGRSRKRWKEEVERDLQVLGVRNGESWWQIGRNGRTLFDRPKPTVGCSANGRKRRRRRRRMMRRRRRRRGGEEEEEVEEEEEEEEEEDTQ
jgi:hypothetical protein